MPVKPKSKHIQIADISNGLEVYLRDRKVGTLAETPSGTVAFQYSEGWLEDGFSISPRSLPLEPQVFIANWQPFAGLHGAFFDSLPDGWGALLMNRMLRLGGYDPASISPLVRLAVVGTHGRGALEYVPSTPFPSSQTTLNFDEMAMLCADILNDKQIDNLDAVYTAGGSSGGARPKAYYQHEGEGWLVKYPSRIDPPNIGQIEYEYMLCAQECGIEIPDVKLFPSEECSGYFAMKRFDRHGDTCVHMLSASALLEVSHRVPALDYRSLFQLSIFLTGSKQEADQLFRRMCFNVFAHNHDDHSNNFTWLCEDGQWRLSPAYDLTYSSTQFAGHTTTVLGQAVPNMDDLLTLSSEVGLNAKEAKRTAEDIRQACRETINKLGLSN